jgi:signal transduction histidine kinase
LTAVGHRLTLAVQDDGRPHSSRRPQASAGVLLIRSYIRLLDGKVQIRSSPRGTRLTCTCRIADERRTPSLCH